MSKSKGERVSLQDGLLEFVQEDNGSFSSTRLAFLLWVVGALIVWSIDSIRAGSPQDITGGVATIIGILMTGKVVQKFGEKPTADQDPDAVKSPTINADGTPQLPAKKPE